MDSKVELHIPDEIVYEVSLYAILSLPEVLIFSLVSKQFNRALKKFNVWKVLYERRYISGKHQEEDKDFRKLLLEEIKVDVKVNPRNYFLSHHFPNKKLDVYFEENGIGEYGIGPLMIGRSWSNGYNLSYYEGPEWFRNDSIKLVFCKNYIFQYSTMDNLYIVVYSDKHSINDDEDKHIDGVYVMKSRMDQFNLLMRGLKPENKELHFKKELDYNNRVKVTKFDESFSLFTRVEAEKKKNEENDDESIFQVMYSGDEDQLSTITTFDFFKNHLHRRIFQFQYDGLLDEDDTFLEQVVLFLMNIVFDQKSCHLVITKCRLDQLRKKNISSDEAGELSIDDVLSFILSESKLYVDFLKEEEKKMYRSRSSEEIIPDARSVYVPFQSVGKYEYLVDPRKWREKKEEFKNYPATEDVIKLEDDDQLDVFEDDGVFKGCLLENWEIFSDKIIELEEGEICGCHDMIVFSKRETQGRLDGVSEVVYEVRLIVTEKSIWMIKNEIYREFAHGMAMT